MWSEQKLALFERYRALALRATERWQYYLGASSVDPEATVSKAAWSLYKRASTMARKAFEAFEQADMNPAQEIVQYQMLDMEVTD